MHAAPNLTMSEDWGQRLLLPSKWIEARDAAKHPTEHREKLPKYYRFQGVEHNNLIFVYISKGSPSKI